MNTQSLIIGIVILLILLGKKYMPIHKDFRRIITDYYGFAENESFRNPPISIELILGIISVESAGDPNVKGSSNETGLMQLTPIAMIDVNNFLLPVEGFTISESQLYEPEFNIKAGTVYLWLRYKFHNDMDKAIRAYNAGDTAVTKDTDKKLYLSKVRASEDKIKHELEKMGKP